MDSSDQEIVSVIGGIPLKMGPLEQGLTVLELDVLKLVEGSESYSTGETGCLLLFHINGEG